MIKIPTRNQFDLPEILEVLEELNIGEKDLLSYLKNGNLAAVCSPYRKELNRKISITPEQWQEAYSAPYEFSVYDGWIGKSDIAETGTSIPLHLLPDEVAELKGTKHADGTSVITTNIVYIELDELVRFTGWHDTESRRIAELVKNAPNQSDTASDQTSGLDRALTNDGPQTSTAENADKGRSKLPDDAAASSPKRSRPAQHRHDSWVEFARKKNLDRKERGEDPMRAKQIAELIFEEERQQIAEGKFDYDQVEVGTIKRILNGRRSEWATGRSPTVQKK